MKKKIFFLLLSVMTLSLLGIIFVQAFWIIKTFNAEEARFSFNARQSLITVAETVRNREIDDYYVQYAAIADTVSKPNSASFSQLFHVEKNDLTNETYLLTNSILQEDYKVRSDVFGEDIDSLDFKKLVNRKVTLVRKNDMEGEMGLSAQEKFERVSRLEDHEKLLFLEAIQDKMEREPIYKRIDAEELKSLLAEQLRLRNITSDFDLGIFSNGLATKVLTDNFSLESASAYGISIFPSENTNYRLYINFPEKQKEIFSSIIGMVLLSVVFTLIILLAFAGAIYQLIKQRRISQIKTDFINNMTHEFKTPISTINLALDSMQNTAVLKDSGKLNNYLEMIRAENRRMHNQVENVLRISRLEKNELDVRKERLKVNNLIDEAVAHVKLLVESRNGYIKTHYKAVQNTILANHTHFVSVLVNLLDNANKYSSQAPSIDIYTENIKNYILIKVCDQGNGMNKAVQKQIFEKFYREHTGDLHNVKGHGLGLAYAKKIIENHQGEILVESEKGKGSTFIIKIPLIS